jgi:hypothetical protein
MNDIDTLLRDTLRERADDAPAGTGLTGRVQARSRRLRTRRRAGALGAAGLFLVVAAIGGQAVLRGIPDGPTVPGHPSGPPPSGPPPSGPAAGRSVAPEPSPVRVVLAPPSYTLPDFPFTPPAWAAEPFGPGRVRFEDGEVTMRHTAGPAGAGSIVVFVTGRAPEPRSAPDRPIAREPVTVRGIAGTRYTEPGSDLVYLAWPEPDGRWIVVTGDRVPAVDLLRYAEDLVATAVPVPAPFEFAWLPRGAAPTRVEPSVMEFQVSNGSLVVSLGPPVPAAERAGWTHRVGGRPASLERDPPVEVGLTVALDSGRTLRIEGRFLDVSDADLVKLAEGIRVTPAATPGG